MDAGIQPVPAELHRWTVALWRRSGEDLGLARAGKGEMMRAKEESRRGLVRQAFSL